MKIDRDHDRGAGRGVVGGPLALRLGVAGSVVVVIRIGSLRLMLGAMRRTWQGLLVSVVTGTAVLFTPGRAEPTSTPSTVLQRPPNGSAPPRHRSAPVFTGEAAVVQQAFMALLNSFEKRDVDTIERVAGTKLGSKADLVSFVKAYRIVLYRIINIAVVGDTATIDYENAIVGRSLRSNVTTLLAQHEIWFKKNGQWMFESDVASAPGIPSDLASVALTLRAGRQIVLSLPLPHGDFAFLVHNTSSVAKGLFILGIPANLDVPSFIDTQIKSTAPGFSPGILEMGATSDIAAGASGTMVFSAALPPGRYLLQARAAKDGTPLRHEYAEFGVN